MRIIFVGVHNKPGMKPLDSKSRSGKLIDKVIAMFQADFDMFEYDFLKTNLWNVNHFPLDPDPWKSVSELKERIDYNRDTDILIGLGACVNEVLTKTNCNFVQMGHPSACWSHKKQAEYIDRMKERVQKYLSQLNSLSLL